MSVSVFHRVIWSYLHIVGVPRACAEAEYMVSLDMVVNCMYQAELHIYANKEEAFVTE